jgi:4'-phosphopantetheinyl transferase EntD
VIAIRTASTLRPRKESIGHYAAVVPVAVELFRIDLQPVGTTQPDVRIARAAMRTILGEALGVAPEAVDISRRCAHCGHESHGRPTTPAAPELSFSLSHSGALAVFALTRDAKRVGVDVEQVRGRASLDKLAARTMSPEQFAEWEREPERLTAFLRTWTAKEAYLKATGVGIATDLRATSTRAVGWTWLDLDLPDGYVGSLAVDTIDPVTLTPAQWRSQNGGTGG